MRGFRKIDAIYRTPSLGKGGRPSFGEEGLGSNKAFVQIMPFIEQRRLAKIT